MNGPIKDCRVCLEKVNHVLELSPTPIANSLSENPGFAMKYPLGLSQCPKCGHVQVSFNISGDQLFSDYTYQTPPIERERLSRLAQALAVKYPNALRGKKDRDVPDVLEIGSNSGIFVDELNKAGFYAVGVDPSPHSPKNGMPKWFNSKTAKLIAFSLGKVNLVLANNVFSHVDDLRNVLAGVDQVLSNDGHLVFEVQYLPSMVAGSMFDMIYHEHKDYHTLKPLSVILAKFNLFIQEVEHFPSHGGSIRVRCGRGRGVEVSDPSIDWVSFKRRIATEGDRLRSLIKGKVACFGAPAKATTLIHHYGIADRIAYCVDETPSKQGLYLPGTGIKIHGPEMLKESPPDFVLISAWNYAEPIRKKLNGLPAIVPFEPEKQRMAA